MAGEDLTFKVASSEERASAIALQSEVYAEELGHSPDDSSYPGALYLIAQDAGGHLLATARLVGPEQRPFEIERFVDLSRVFPGEPRLALGGRLCVHPSHRRVPASMFILAGLLNLTHTLATARDWTKLIIYPRTELVPFYRGAMFRETGVTFLEPDFDLTMHLMYWDVKRFRQLPGTSVGPLARRLRSPSS